MTTRDHDSMPLVSTDASSDLERERAYTTFLYEQLDSYRRELLDRLANVRLNSAGGTHQWRTERDALARQFERRLSSIVIGDLPLYFGRLDLGDDSRLHIGRVGIDHEDADSEAPLLIDWRAPIASLFYSATPGSPEGVVRRRHLLSKGREVVAIDDEIFDLDRIPDENAGELHGDAALLAAVSKGRTGFMRDIVSTIQREQDEVIRSEMRGVLVVQGGPGTGKTAVALHRAAYLLYTHRQRLSSTGVLVVGPNPTFMRYVEQVLPSLGETGAVLSTIQHLLPGIRPNEHDESTVAELKGSAQMATVISAAVRDRERLLREDLDFAFERSSLKITREMCERARRAARRSSLPHNQARRIVENVLLDRLVNQIREQQSATAGLPPSVEDLADARERLRRSKDVRTVLERIWPELSPQRFLNELFGSMALLRSAAKTVESIDVDLLFRERLGDPDAVAWTIEDVPLLDEAADLLGPIIDSRRARRVQALQSRERQDREFASDVLGSLNLGIAIDIERFAARFADESSESIAELAARDRTWKFGHVIIDEAQELSPMAWRMLFRRNPNRSMTIVGDLAQQSSNWARSSWGDILDHYAKDRWRVAELTVNYRNPSEIMELANKVLAAVAPSVTPPVSIRSTGEHPRWVHVQHGTVDDAVVEAVRHEIDELDDGRLAVIAPTGFVSSLREHLAAELGEHFNGGDPIGSRVALLDVVTAKGLEYDVVVLVEPGRIATDTRQGLNDLYVALTRATRRVVIIYAEDLPIELCRDAPAE